MARRGKTGEPWRHRAAGLLDRRAGSRAVLVAGAALSGGGYGFVAIAHDAMWQLYAGALTRGIGLGLAYAAVANLAVAAAPDGETGVVTGINTLVRSAGASVGAQASAVIVGASVTAGTGLPREIGFTLAFATSGAVMVVVLLLAVITPARRTVPA